MNIFTFFHLSKFPLLHFVIFLMIILFSGCSFLSLPEVDHLITQDPLTTSLIEKRKKEAEKMGKELKIYHKWVNFADIPELLKQTVRISEDAGFYFHKGIDFNELREAIKENLIGGKRLRGGSTITQQLAKNLDLSMEKPYYRKIKEFFIAQKLERTLSKDRIFCLYLNVIEFGEGIFGVGAASEYYFGKPVHQLNLPEIVRLTAVIPRPLKVNPLSNSHYIKWRATMLLEKLYQYNHISQSNYQKASEEFEE